MEVKTVSRKHIVRNVADDHTDDSTSGFNKCVGITRFICKLNGIWPDLEDNERSFLDRILFVFPASFILISILIPQFRRAIIYRKDINAVIEVLSTAIFSDTIALWKLLGCRYNQAGLKELMVAISQDWKKASDKEKIIMWKYSKLSNFIVGCGLSLTVGDVMALGLYVPILYFSQVHHAAENETIPKPLFLKGDFYFDMQRTPIHEIVYLSQFIASFFATFCFTSCDGFFVCSILHFSGQFENLQIEIQSLMEKRNEKNDSFLDALVPIVRRHWILCRYTALIEENFNKIFLFQIMATSILLCLHGYEFASILAESGVEMLAGLIFIACYATSMMVSILMYCYVAEILRTQSSELFHTIYNINWYNLPPHESKLLIIIMNRTRLPIEITMGKFVAFSLECFCSVMKTSAGYLSVLLAMKEKL